MFNSMIEHKIETHAYLGVIDTETASKVNAQVYKCSHCKTSLFTDLNLMQMGKQEATELCVENLLRPMQACSANCLLLAKYSTETMEWMLHSGFFVTKILRSKGKIQCPHCRHRIGKWNWKESQPCSSSACVAGVAPTFLIEKKHITVSDH